MSQHSAHIFYALAFAIFYVHYFSFICTNKTKPAYVFHKHCSMKLYICGMKSLISIRFRCHLNIDVPYVTLSFDGSHHNLNAIQWWNINVDAFMLFLLYCGYYSFSFRMRFFLTWFSAWLDAQYRSIVINRINAEVSVRIHGRMINRMNRARFSTLLSTSP